MVLVLYGTMLLVTVLFSLWCQLGLSTTHAQWSWVDWVWIHYFPSFCCHVLVQWMEFSPSCLFMCREDCCSMQIEFPVPLNVLLGQIWIVSAIFEYESTIYEYMNEWMIFTSHNKQLHQANFDLCDGIQVGLCLILIRVLVAMGLEVSTISAVL